MAGPPDDRNSPDSDGPPADRGPPGHTPVADARAALDRVAGRDPPYGVAFGQGQDVVTVAADRIDHRGSECLEIHHDGRYTTVNGRDDLISIADGGGESP